MQLIDVIHLVMAILFTTSALIKLKHHQPEHFFTRIMNAAWFFATVIDRDMPVLFVRTFSTSFIVILLMAEVLSPLFRWNMRRRDK